MQFDHISDLTDQQIVAVGGLLEKIFLYDDPIDTISDDHIALLLKVLSCFSIPGPKAHVFSRLSADSQIRLAPHLTEADLEEFFISVQDFLVLEKVFKTLPKTVQNTVLKALYRVNTAKYRLLKNFSQDKISMVGHLLIKQDHVLKKMIEKEKQDILDAIFDPRLSFENTMLLSKTCEKKYEIEDQELLAISIIDEFKTLHVGFDSPENCAIYLKFFHFIDLFLIAFPSLESRLTPILDIIVTSLDRFPDGIWIVKVLGQFPLSTIRTTLGTVMGYEKIKNFEKRNLYCRILNDIKQNIDHPEAGSIRFAFSQL